MILAGYNLLDIQEHLPGDNKAKTSQIREAIQSLSEMAKEPQDAITGFAMCATRELYRKMLDSADYVGALRAVKQLHELSNARK